jgi:hypothetical protein
MLTDEHSSVLQKKIYRTYKIHVQNDQIVSLMPSRFECKLMFYQDDTKFLLSGKANQFNKLPIAIFFIAPKKSKERKALEKRISEDGSDLHLDFNCEVNSQGQAYRTNTLVINGEQISQLGIVEDLFGPANEVFVTRNQLQELASDVYSNLNILEEYQIAESQFSANFIEDFIKQTASSALKPVDFENALSQLSSYKINEDLKPSLIKSELSKIFKINQTDSKSRIVLNDEFNLNSKNSNEKFKGSLNWLGGKADYEKQVNDLSISGKSVDDQLKELNLLDKSDIEWKRDGEIIVPKTIKVHRFNRANFSKSLVFKRIKREFYDALYKKSFILSTQDTEKKIFLTLQNDFTKNSINAEDLLKKESDNIKSYRSTTMLPRGTILMVASKLVNEWFNANGYGLGEYDGWYLCDGRNGTPDLRAKFIVGWDNLSYSNSSKYSSVGNKGGNSFVRLTERELPSHSHVEWIYILS